MRPVARGASHPSTSFVATVAEKQGWLSLLDKALDFGPSILQEPFVPSPNLFLALTRALCVQILHSLAPT